MKKITSWLLAITLLANIAFVTSCKKDDDPEINKVEGVEFTDSYGYLLVTWDIVENATVYMVEVNGINVSDTPLVFPAITMDYPTIGTKITINAYSDITMTSMIASTTIDYEGIADDVIKNITFSEIGNSIIISWDPFTDAASYMVSISGVALSEYPITSTSFSTGILTDGMVITVEAFSDPLMETLIATGTATYESQATGYIENLTLTENNGVVSVNWDAYTGAAGYMIKNNNVNVLSSTISYTSYSLGTLDNGDIITVEAYSDLSGLNLIAYAETVYTVNEEQPQPVSNLIEYETGSDFVTLNWANPYSDYTQIEIYSGPRVEGNTANLVAFLSSGQEYYTIEDLESNSTYTFYVYVVNENNSLYKYSTAEYITITTDDEQLSMVGSEWYNPGSAMFPIEMNLWFGTNTVDWEEGDYYHEGLSYTFNPITRTGIIDEGGYYEGEFVVSADGTSLTFMDSFDFIRVGKK